MRLCRSLEIERGLKDCLDYLQKHIPADALYLEQYEPENSAMRLIARATAEGAQGLDIPVPLPESATAAMVYAATTDWSSFEAGLFSPDPHPLLHESFWDEPSQTSTERRHVVDARTRAVERHAMTTVAWKTKHVVEMLRDLGFGSVETRGALTGVSNLPDGPLFVVVAQQ